jgi:hypothetical protein
LQEVRRLEKLRAKRAFEASLPAIDDVARLPERQAMIEAWEVQEWMEREEEIKGVQEERLSLLAQALQVHKTSPSAAKLVHCLKQQIHHGFVCTRPPYDFIGFRMRVVDSTSMQCSQDVVTAPWQQLLCPAAPNKFPNCHLIT